MILKISRRYLFILYNYWHGEEDGSIMFMSPFHGCWCPARHTISCQRWYNVSTCIQRYFNIFVVDISNTQLA